MVESMYAMQSAMEIALKNSMLVSNLKAHGKSPRFFYLDPVDSRKAERILGENLLRTFRNVRMQKLFLVLTSQSCRLLINRSPEKRISEHWTFPGRSLLFQWKYVYLV